MSNEENIQNAIAAHGDWKLRLQTAIETSQCEISPETASRHDACAFGRWLYAEGTCASAGEGRCDRIRSLHAGFHKEAGRILAFALAGKQDEAIREFQPNSTFANLSGSLVIEMLGWLRELNQAAREH